MSTVGKAGLDQADEERVELVVFGVTRLAQARHRVLAHRAEHLEPCAQHGAPLVGEVLDADGAEAGRAQQRAIGVERLQRGGGHPLAQAPALAVAEGGPRDPVGEG